MPRAARSPGGLAETLAVGLPMVVSQSCDTVMIFVSRWQLSQLDDTAMNAAFLGGLSAFAVQTFFVGLIGYSTALVAQSFGAGRPERCQAALGQALLVAVLAYPVMLCAIPLGRALFPRLGLPEEQLAPQQLYFETLLWGSVLGLLRGAFAGYFSGLGRTRVVMLASLLSMVSNVPLVYVLVFGKLGLPPLGILGAALGMLVAGGLGLSTLLFVFLRERARQPRASLGFERGLFFELLRKGSPAGLEFFLNLLSFHAMVVLFQRQGAVSATAASILFNWDMVAFVPLVGMEIAVTSLVGRYVGADDAVAVRRTLRSGLTLGLLFSSLVFVGFVAFPEVLVDVFRPETNAQSFEAARGLAITMLRIASAYVGIDALLLVFAGALRGAGDTFFTMVVTVALHWLLVLVLALSLEVLKLGTLTSWSILVGLFMLFPAALALRWRSGRWRRKRPEPALLSAGLGGEISG